MAERTWSPTNAASDDAGSGTLGAEAEAFWRDHDGAGINAIRTQTQIRAADVVIVRFGDKNRSGTRPSSPIRPLRSTCSGTYHWHPAQPNA
jgi:hypothetical protein